MINQSKKFRVAFLAILTVLILVGCNTLAPAATEIPAGTLAPEETEVITGDTAEAPSEEPETDPTDVPATGDFVPQSGLDETFEPFWEVWDLLNRYYVDQPLDPDKLASGAIEGLGAYLEMPDVAVSDDTAQAFSSAADTPRDAREAFLPFWQAWAAAGDQADTLAMRAALSGMIDSLGDQHTSYMDPDQFTQANIPVDGSYEGIGAWVDPNDEYLTIVTPMPDSPAEKAGLLPGDKIVKVDGEDMTGIDGNLVIRRVLGPAGTDVVLTIRREGSEDFDVTVTRAKIIVPSVDGYIIEDTNIAYVALFSFGESSADDLRATLVELLAQNPDGLIFDLRNNGGGLLVSSVEVASEFIKDGLILSEVYGDGTRDTFEATGDGVATDIPMVVLANGGSASASEIVIGALRAYGRAQIVGTTTFGKGTVQNWIPLPDSGAVRITIAKWLSPGDVAIHEIGIEPDVVVEITEDDVTNNVDPQLQKAIELLSQP